MKKYEYKHASVPFTEEQLLMLGMPLGEGQREKLDEVLEKT